MKRSLLFVVMAIFITVFIPSAAWAVEESNVPVDLENPGLEAADMKPWYWWGEAGTGTYGVSDYVHGGGKSIKIVADKGDFIPMGLLQDFECAAGDEITASAWIMSPESNPLTNSNAFVRLEFWNDKDVIKAFESQHLTGAFKWTKSAISGKAPDGTTKAKIGLFIWNPGGGHSGAVYFDDPEVLKKAPPLF